LIKNKAIVLVLGRKKVNHLEVF